MKKVSISFLIICVITTLASSQSAYSMSFGSYNTDTEYGLLDGFKFNFSRKDKSEKLMEVKEGKTREQREKEKKEIPEDIYLRNLIENRSII